MRYSVRLMPARGTQGFRKYGRYRTVTEISGLRAIAFSSRRLPMKHHGHTTSDTTSIGSAVAPALAGAGIGFSSMFEEKIGRPRGKGNTAPRRLRRISESNACHAPLQAGHPVTTSLDSVSNAAHGVTGSPGHSPDQVRGGG